MLGTECVPGVGEVDGFHSSGFGDKHLSKQA